MAQNGTYDIPLFENVGGKSEEVKFLALTNEKMHTVGHGHYTWLDFAKGLECDIEITSRNFFFGPTKDKSVLRTFKTSILISSQPATSRATKQAVINYLTNDHDNSIIPSIFVFEHVCEAILGPANIWQESSSGHIVSQSMETILVTGAVKSHVGVHDCRQRSDGGGLGFFFINK